MPLTGVVYFSHAQRDEKGEMISEGVECAHCKKPLVDQPFLIMISEARDITQRFDVHFAHEECERTVQNRVFR